MSQQHSGNQQLSFNSYRMPIALIGEIHQYLSQRPAIEVRNLLNAIDSALLADDKAQLEAQREAQEAEQEKVVLISKEKA